MSENKEEKVEETTEEVVEETVEEVEETTEPDYKDQYLRLMAELANYKKRTQKESLATYANAVCDTVEKLLPFIDSFDRAVSSIDKEDSSPVAQGLMMIYKQLEEVLDKLEVKKIEALNCQFDPNFHNAVMHTDDDSVGENIVVEEFMAGYMYKDKVIRHSMVKVMN